MTVAAFASIVLVHLLAAISPGPSFVVAARTAAAEGFATALAFAVGLGLGAAAWALVALVGLAALLEAAPAFLTALKVAGGLFLVWIGLATWRSAGAPLPQPGPGAEPRGFAAAVRFGLATQLANPKVPVFFGAVFAGLVPADATPLALGLLLAAIFASETLWYACVARAFSLDRARAGYARVKRGLDRVFGGLIAGFGLKIAAS